MKARPAGETPPVVENLLIDRFAADRARRATSGTSDQAPEYGTRDAAARRADGTGDETRSGARFGARQGNGDGARCASRGTYGTANTPRDVTRFDAW